VYNQFCLHDYHWVWYIIGFTLSPRLVLAILVSFYVPISISLKVLMWAWGILCLNSKSSM